MGASLCRLTTTVSQEVKIDLTVILLRMLTPGITEDARLNFRSSKTGPQRNLLILELARPAALCATAHYLSLLNWTAWKSRTSTKRKRVNDLRRHPLARASCWYLRTLRLQVALYS